ncbi:PucR family transcriptional regulator [Desulfosporosinus nitroreducens]|uniref:Helix-turn-helix domain-containing protein n=1 Tax=Desulfosporosinus nitroreducens TaxID=2018668 RepID=A0ABT8QLV1_9FIRM|nr:helix-turn-helix domain-containing protein [Desulfosporosinus nitroreducens]MCO1601362.1 helix-turn-helix domain-containing protein [Desulfosporosinus nitroreducens]MDO0821852.1 helix-turn-helix domain-containing protein [Desulfosporosinus nitroreducens]
MEQQNSLLSQFSLRLVKTLSKESGLQALVDLGYEVLGNPFTVTDYSVKVLASTGETKVTDDPVWNELKMNNNFFFQTYSYYLRNSLFNEIARSDAPFYWSDAYCKYPRLIGKIRISNRDVASIVVCAHNRDFKESDEELLSLLCDAFSIEFQKTKYIDFSQGLMHQSFLYDLLDGKFEDERLIVERLKILGLKFKSKLFVINIDIENLDRLKSTLPYLRGKIENTLSNAKAIVYNQNIVVLASSESGRHFQEIELKTLKEFINANNIQAGISRPFSKLTDVREHYLESVEAIKLGSSIKSEQHFYEYQDFIIFDLISNYAHGEKSKKLIHHSLIKLIEYDKENGTDYVQSFYTYISNFKNIKDSANILNIHRNTMFHRIEKIEKLLNVDLNDGDVFFQLYLSYKILEFYKITLP